MHFHPILLVKADSLDEAKVIAEHFCDSKCGAYSQFDYGAVIPDKNTVWNKPLIEVKDKLPKANHIEDANVFLAKARSYLEKMNQETAGYYFIKAGELFCQQFSTEHQVFNIEDHDYNQDYSEGWYAIEADFHF